ncbi:DUF4123 domain-containing protein [Xanthomonas oryzae]|uniref:DUF4123 domain-containing protein n=3 Tax=Xanthomonas oryzae TaxID=347 RepID=UPI00211C09BD|nr:DUF4123 domain-containing protein [Xanthomonas oryzae]
MPALRRRRRRATVEPHMRTWHQFAVIDCAVDPTYLSTLQHHAAASDLEIRSLFEHQPEAEHVAASPWLIELPIGAVHPGLDTWLAQLGRTAAGATRLASEVPFDELFTHLEQQLDVELPDGSLALMRFYDARAWLRYMEVLTLAQQLELLGPILEWQVMALGQHWTLSRDEARKLQETADAAADT